MKNFNILLMLLFFSSSCQENKDPLAKLNEEVLSYNELKTMLSDGKYIKGEDMSVYYLRDEDSVYVLSLNPNPDGYLIGNIRQVVLTFNDYQEKKAMSYDRLDEYKKSQRIKAKSVLGTYMKWYGKPSSIKKIYPQKRFPETEFDIYDSTRASGNVYKWEDELYNITFIKGNTEWDSYKSINHIFEDDKIIYEIFNFENQLRQIKDSIRQSLKPNDIISYKVYFPTWEYINDEYDPHSEYDWKITVSAKGDITRLDSEDPRSVSSIKFHIVIKDKYNDEIFTMGEWTHDLAEPRKPLDSRYRDSMWGQVAVREPNMDYSIKYNSQYTKSAELYEKARLLNNKDGLSAEVVIDAIFFSDGTVKKN